MLFGQFPYREKTEEKMIRAIRKTKPNFDIPGADCSEEIKKLILKMIEYDEKKRISFQELYSLPYF